MPAKQPKKPTWKLWMTSDGRYSPYQQKTQWNYRTKQNDPVEMTEVSAGDCEFVAAMKLKSFHHGRSCHFYFENIQTGHQYMMQGTEMEEILFNHTMHQGLICGRWGWVKKGGVISIKLLEELDDVEGTRENSA